MATWEELEAHARKRAKMDGFGTGWMAVLWSIADGEPVRVLLKHLTVSGQSYLGAVTGGCPASRVSADEILRWNSSLPPGCTVIIDDGCLWIRWLTPAALLSMPGLEFVVSYVARNGARLLVKPRHGRRDAACVQLFAGFGA